MKYVQQLDALRAFAVIAVMIHHFCLDPFTQRLALGQKGVCFFFVLSGFLITSILLKQKDHIDAGRGSIFASVKQFFIRRTFRIFPIYYLTLIVAALSGLQVLLASAPWHFLYASNIYIGLINKWPVPLSHLWSLAVEEQFYLIWPWVVFFIPKRYLRLVFISVFLFGFLARIIFKLWLGCSDISIYVSTYCNVDFIAIGALLALYSNMRYAISSQIKVFFIIGSLLFICVDLCRIYNLPITNYPFYKTFSAMLFVSIIYVSTNVISGLWGMILNCKAIIYIGRISYGIYLYHLFVPTVMAPVLRMYKIDTTFLAPLYVTVTILMASLSWTVIEKPLNYVKDMLSAEKTTKCPVST